MSEGVGVVLQMYVEILYYSKYQTWTIEWVIHHFMFNKHLSWNALLDLECWGWEPYIQSSRMLKKIAVSVSAADPVYQGYVLLWEMCYHLLCKKQLERLRQTCKSDAVLCPLMYWNVHLILFFALWCIEMYVWCCPLPFGLLKCTFDVVLFPLMYWNIYVMHHAVLGCIKMYIWCCPLPFDVLKVHLMLSSALWCIETYMWCIMLPFDVLKCICDTTLPVLSYIWLFKLFIRHMIDNVWLILN